MLTHQCAVCHCSIAVLTPVCCLSLQHFARSCLQTALFHQLRANFTSWFELSLLNSCNHQFWASAVEQHSRFALCRYLQQWTVHTDQHRHAVYAKQHWSRAQCLHRFSIWRYAARECGQQQHVNASSLHPIQLAHSLCRWRAVAAMRARATDMLALAVDICRCRSCSLLGSALADWMIHIQVQILALEHSQSTNSSSL